MAPIQTRRQFIAGAAAAGATGLLGAPHARAAEGAIETTSVRLTKSPGLCIAPQYVAEELLRAQGFTDIRYVDVPPGATEPVVAGVRRRAHGPFLCPAPA
jgi:NitT/TauT family transport system substrate-binding protein